MPPFAVKRKRSASTLQQASTIAPKPQSEAAASGGPAGKLKSGAKIKPALGPDANGGAPKAGKAGGTEGLFSAFLALAQSIQNKESSTQKLKDKSILSRLAGQSAAKGLSSVPAKAGGAKGAQGAGTGSSVQALLTRSASEAANSKAEIESVKATVKTKSLADGTLALDKASKDLETSAEKADKPKSAAKGGHVPQSGLEFLLAQARDAAKPSLEGGPSGRFATEASKALGQAGEAKSEAPKLQVNDLRKRAVGKKEAANADAAQAAQLAPDAAGKPVGKVAELDLDLSRAAALKAEGGGGGESSGSGETAKAGNAPAREFSSVLTEQLKATWNGDIVKTAHIVLRDGDAGMIRLRLHPESLGGVKIELKLADNSISGRIVVESDEAKTAFERNMGQLQDAFRQGGFESARLDVQVGSGQTGTAGGQAGEGPKPFWSERKGIESLEAAVPESRAAAWMTGSNRAVNILA